MPQSSLTDLLSAAYAARLGLGPETDTSVLARTARDSFDDATLAAKRDAFRSVADRCVVSRLGAEFLDRVLSLTPAAAP